MKNLLGILFSLCVMGWIVSFFAGEVSPGPQADALREQKRGEQKALLVNAHKINEPIKLTKVE